MNRAILLFKDERELLMRAAQSLVDIAEREKNLSTVKKNQKLDESVEETLIDAATTLLNIAKNEAIPRDTLRAKAVKLTSDLVAFLEACDGKKK